MGEHQSEHQELDLVVEAPQPEAPQPQDLQPEDARNKHSVTARIEALLFASGDGLDLELLSEILGLPTHAVLDALERYQKQLEEDLDRGLTLRKIKERYCLSTKAELNADMEQLFTERKMPKLTKAAYEVLAIVAYNEPCTRAQVETVRGVNSDSVVSRLLELNLIERTGELDLPGRPSLYSVSTIFLRHFGLSSAKDLPAMELLSYESIQAFEQKAKRAGIDLK